MKRPDDPMREIAALRERLSRLSEASLHFQDGGFTYAGLCYVF